MIGTNEKGNIGLLRAISWFQENGYIVFIPIGHSGAVDIVVAKPNEVAKRVQCKWTGRLSRSAMRNPLYEQTYDIDFRSVPKRINGKWGIKNNYTDKSFDFLFVSCPNGDYLFPWIDEITTKSHTTLGSITHIYKVN